MALCTFDGAHFLSQQLDSLLAQTRLPDELVACDDGSGDGTMEILEDFARRSSFPVRLVRNPQRLGIAKNFEQAISLCSGEIIALADQDDVWQAAKLEQLACALAEPGVSLAFSNADVVDESLRPLGYTMWQRVGFDKRERMRMEAGDALDVLLKHYVVTGATMAFRADLRNLLLPLPPEWPHDAWIASVAAAVSAIRPLNDTLTQYRQHGGNAVGGNRTGIIGEGKHGLALGRETYYRDEIGRFQVLLERLQAAGIWKAADSVAAKLAHLRIRAGLPRNRLRRLPFIAGELARGGYRRYARNWESIAMDLFFPWGGN